MSSYALFPFVPGPTTVYPAALAALSKDYGSGQIEDDFFLLHRHTTSLLQDICGTENDFVFMTGEGILALWAGLKSTLQAGDKVLCIGTGFFGDGIASMAKSIGCDVQLLSFPHDTTISTPEALQQIEKVIEQFKPKMMTLVHCETPSGTMNPLVEVGALKKQYNVPLFYVDAVASAGGVPIDADAAHIDLLLLGSQKCFSAPPSLSMIGVSPKAWEYIGQVQYQGYDALLPFQHIYQQGRSPYTPYWHGLAALHAACKEIMTEGVETVFTRHQEVAELCRNGLQSLGIRLYPQPTAVCAATVTAAYVPSRYTWEEWRLALREKGIVIAGTFGDGQGKVFRVGHMGTQADKSKMEEFLLLIQPLL